MSIFPRGKRQEKEARKWEKEIKKGKGGWDPFFSLMRWYHLQGQGEKLEGLVKRAPTQELRWLWKSLDSTSKGKRISP